MDVFEKLPLAPTMLSCSVSISEWRETQKQTLLVAT